MALKETHFDMCDFNGSLSQKGSRPLNDIKYTLFFVRIPGFLPSFNIDSEPRKILKLFLTTKGVLSPKNLRKILRSLSMFYYTIELSKSLYFVSMMQKCI